MSRPHGGVAREAPEGSFAGFVHAAASRGELVVQPRMGFSDPRWMHAGLLAVKGAAATAAGTITLDSFTRTGDLTAAGTALVTGVPLNGYPITSHPLDVTRSILNDVRDRGFPVQVRHGSAAPQEIFRTLTRLGIDATEGGPVSYCLPYGAVPLHDSIRNWKDSCWIFAELRTGGLQPHLETFGGCMMGQLGPPALHVAISVLEAMFFRQHGIQSVSLSFAQQTNFEQDMAGISALRRLATDLLGDCGWHIVVYTYMGVFPRTVAGATLLGETAVRLAVHGGAQRIIVKTTAEATRIPTIEDNVVAIERAALVAATLDERERPDVDETLLTSEVHAEAAALVHGVLDLRPDIGDALEVAFRKGYLDVPFCLHPDNKGRARSYIRPDGRLAWSDVGAMPLHGVADISPGRAMRSSELMRSLSYVAERFDNDSLDGRP
ncbi:methylaspartate mutase [Streptomyces sp. NRRL F-5126]|uniref:methylaspartate mutase n=1 Tax=Streptomyces sp. NRRL F-5126 TaxID=1463857 RepID=UPI00099DB513|nr:methylaspartate mutase [Streptomyces sp. NRRL F-5126]